MSRKGFTLAEILITLTVIGVVAALTIPTLLQNTNQAELKAALKKDFGDISQASIIIANDQGGTLGGTFGSNMDSQTNDNFKNLFKNKLNYIKDCSFGSGACWHGANDWFNWQGVKMNDVDVAYWHTRPGLILNNGALVITDLVSTNCTGTIVSNNDVCAQIIIDVNGFKPPNTDNKDIFCLYVLNRGNLLIEGGNAYYLYQ